MSTFEDLFQSAYAVFDGGIATELYERGFYINRPFEELNTTHPRDVVAVHESYIDAGATAITTNSFSLTTSQLEKFDISHRQSELINAAINLAAEASLNKGVGTKVGLSFGPMGVLIEPLGRTSKDEVRNEYEKLATFAQITPRFDFYNLETFSNIEELECAIQGIRRVDKSRPILASITVVSAETNQIQQFAKRIGGLSEVQALGMNCSEGPHDLLQSLKVLKPLTDKPIIIQPNAGIPRNINGRYFSMTSPDYMAKFAKRFIEAGAFGVGGCCGTGPDDIRAIAKSIKMMEVKRTDLDHHPIIQIANNASVISDAIHKTLAERKASKIGQKILQGKKAITIELTSPRGTDMSKFLVSLEKVRAAGVEFVNVPEGARASTRVSSLHLAAYVNSKPELGITIMPHLTTRDRNLIALQADLLGA